MGILALAWRCWDPRERRSKVHLGRWCHGRLLERQSCAKDGAGGKCSPTQHSCQRRTLWAQDTKDNPPGPHIPLGSSPTEPWHHVGPGGGLPKVRMTGIYWVLTMRQTSSALHVFSSLLFPNLWGGQTEARRVRELLQGHVDSKWQGANPGSQARRSCYTLLSLIKTESV